MAKRVSRARGIPLRAIAPNAVTALALCSGLTGVRYGISGEWERAVLMILLAGALDGIDGQIARMVRGESRFGAELDSLADSISFGVSPALVMYLWSLMAFPRIGWIVALVYAVFAALRLARFNAQIDVVEQPHKSAGFLTGVPAPAGAGLAMLPMYLSFWTGEELFRSYWLVTPWVAFVAFLMVSNLATFSWSSLKLRRTIRFEAIIAVVVVAAAMVSAPFQTLSVVCVAYLVSIPFSIASYGRVKRQRATVPASPSPSV
ncbi:CDP-diacylglycerol--serine O-phosphatidyltransferase [Sphingomonas sp. 37zxx]|uniref:CDP-diacylglycerol--serine O-phosphatidyltransferase n=1 Tax=Sphingomonas sp. 37zxx TaxID=1550073 RepID=UPI000ADC0B08|nr:CDP-diacylglycerol--serine O-phosphatidyltransferase [Sphingomonas sp. 37zxx]